ncbi:MAG: META domain-containing protein [Rhodanobacteraceae bacterium]|nr:MAG: META domain-containing protein [Rhodanobacteraceae bacterium]
MGEGTDIAQGDVAGVRGRVRGVGPSPALRAPSPGGEGFGDKFLNLRRTPHPPFLPPCFMSSTHSHRRCTRLIQRSRRSLGSAAAARSDMRTTPMVLMFALAMTGCAVHAARDPEPAPPISSAASASDMATSNLDATAWRFVEVAGRPVPAGVHAILRLRAGRASGKAGCNSFGATWQQSADGGAVFGQVMSTKMACMQPAGAMQVEHGVFAALRDAARIERDGDSLVLLDASGKPLARLAPDTASPRH